jgi:homocitrate synthase
MAIHFPTLQADGGQGSNTRPKTPYGNITDFLSNVGRFKIIESTLRGAASPRPRATLTVTEGEQFATAHFTTEQKIKM